MSMVAEKSVTAENSTTTEAPARTDNPVEVMQQLLAGFAVELVKDPSWQAILQQVPRSVKRELGRRFGYLVMGLQSPLEEEEA